jgi:hypothetical protein
MKESTDGAEAPEEDTRRNIDNDRPPGLASPKRGARGKEHNRMADGTSTTLPRRNMTHIGAIVVGTDNKPSKTFIRKPS